MRTLFRGKILTIPNLLSAVRILLIPVFMWFYLHDEDLPATVTVLALSAATDVLDGFIARRFHMISDFGKALDPFADKLTQLAVFSCLLVRFPGMLWLLIVLCVKEVFVACTQLIVIRKTDLVLGAAWYGKVTTMLLYTVMIAHLSWPYLPQDLSWLSILCCILFLLLSGVLYGVRNIRAARSGSLPPAEEGSSDPQPDA